MPFRTFMEYPSTNTSIASSGLGKWTRASATGDWGDGGGGFGVGSSCGDSEALHHGTVRETDRE